MNTEKRWIMKECQNKIFTARMKGIRKRERPQKRWTDAVEKDLKIMGIRNLHTVARDWRRTIFEAKVHSGL
jgi:hypothetical protein